MSRTDVGAGRPLKRRKINTWHIVQKGSAIFVSRFFPFFSCSVRSVRNSVFSAATGYQCYGMLYFILMGHFRRFNITLQLTRCVKNCAKGEMVSTTRQSEKSKFENRRICSVCPTCYLSAPWKLNVFSFHLNGNMHLNMPQKCLSTIVRGINNDSPSTLVCAKKLCGTKEWATLTHARRHTQQKWTQ